MDDIPPSYEAAIARSPWSVLAPHISSADLCSLNRVSHELNQIFAPCLWGNPASHFGTENDRVYVALTRFKRTLRRVRLRVRQLTHTLHLPPAQSEIYDGPRPEWLREVLEQLPNLQSLVVSRLPFFDHVALLALKSESNRGLDISARKSDSISSLRLLIAANCQNTTAQGLTEGLNRFLNLTFLDLSRTLAARDRSVLIKLNNLPLLQTLKLRNVHLRDEDISTLANAIQMRVRSLDVSYNHLTDHSVRILLAHCFSREGQASDVAGPTNPLHSSDLDDWPEGFARPDPTILDEFRDESYDKRLLKRLTSQVVSRLPFEDFPNSGITHLFIADNELSVEGLAALVRTQKLRVLDAGSLDMMRVISRQNVSTSSNSAAFDRKGLELPGVEKLVPVLGRSAENLTSLRIDHTLVTKEGPSEEEVTPSFAHELATDNSSRVLGSPIPELDGVSPPLYELDSREVVQNYELPGNHVEAFEIQRAKKLQDPSAESSSELRRGSVFAPEPMPYQDSDGEEKLVLTATGLESKAQRMNGITYSTSNEQQYRISNSTSSKQGQDLSIALIQRQRRELREVQTSKPHGLMPGMLSNLRTLTLTNVPCYARSPKVVQALIQFVRYCASEANLASLQARLESSTSRRVPQISKRSTHKLNTYRHFALQRIVLEMSQQEPLSSPSRSWAPYRFRQSGSKNHTMSSTEDADSEVLWSASQNDFTFFDDDEECGLPSLETGTMRTLPLHALSEKIIMPTASDSQDGKQKGSPSTENTQHGLRLKTGSGLAVIDVVKELVEFRKERKAAYQMATEKGIDFIDGYWPGEIKVVRGNARTSISSEGMIDYYGNFFENGYVYR